MNRSHCPYFLSDIIVLRLSNLSFSSHMFTMANIPHFLKSNRCFTRFLLFFYVSTSELRLIHIITIPMGACNSVNINADFLFSFGVIGLVGVINETIVQTHFFTNRIHILPSYSFIIFNKLKVEIYTQLTYPSTTITCHNCLSGITKR